MTKEVPDERGSMAEMVRTTPSTNGEAPMARRAPKGLLPSTWLDRTLKIEYTGADGRAQSTTGTLLDTYPIGPVFDFAGAKCLLSWDQLVLLELVND